jgi:lipoyl synthase
MSVTGPKPEWLRVKAHAGETPEQVRWLLRSLNLNSICEQAGCPNCGECFGRRTAAFLILGSVCSRNCRFCQVHHGYPQPVDPQEPLNLAKAVQAMNLGYVVVTSVTRDDLPDGGAGHFAAVIQAIRDVCGEKAPKIEVLVPDFQGNLDALRSVIAAGPDVLNHNVETVPRLYAEVRPQAIYQRSLDLLANARKLNPQILTKSGLMVGLGEAREEVLAVLRDLRANQCDLVTIGQYLAPSRDHLPVTEYIHPDVFEWYRQEGEAMGFRAVASGPFIRSSYRADELL